MQNNGPVMECQFTSTAPGQWTCANCNRPTSPKRHYEKPPFRTCPNAPDLQPIAQRLAEETGDPSILTKMGHYGVALLHWSLGGFKTRSKEEVARIYETHCRPCEKFDSDADACKICRCNVKVEAMAIFSMLAMETEHCRDGKW